MPLGRVARERLRDQQQEESRRLAAVISAQSRLDAERSKAATAIAKAEERVAVRQASLDAAVLNLLDTSGMARTAILLDHSAADLARLRRARKRAQV